ncbi:MAG: hypothetical protein LBT65_07590 [Synergistaceae bacterium]|jgi:hypothetical protein|nr:hypothetical protein [Synergistaceae bacterium]
MTTDHTRPSAPKFSDPLTATGEELEALRGELDGDVESKKAEFARFREETLEHLSAMCDRTIESARLEEERLRTRVARDREEIDARIDSLREMWGDRLSGRDEAFLDAFVTDVVQRLLPSDFLSDPPSGGSFADVPFPKRGERS